MQKGAAVFTTYERVSGSEQPRPVGRIEGTALGRPAGGPPREMTGEGAEVRRTIGIAKQVPSVSHALHLRKDDALALPLHVCTRTPHAAAVTDAPTSSSPIPAALACEREFEGWSPHASPTQVGTPQYTARYLPGQSRPASIASRSAQRAADRGGIDHPPSPSDIKVSCCRLVISVILSFSEVIPSFD